MDNPLWGDDWAAVRSNWTLDPEVTFLNHGSFGAAPRPVLEVQARLRAEMERQPVRFLDRTLRARLDAALTVVGAFLGADPRCLAFVPNATYAINSVVQSLRFEPGDELLIVEHGYPAIIKTLLRVSDRTGASVVRLPISFPRQTTAEIGETILAALCDRTRLLVLDQITSPTAMILPAREIVRACRQRGILVLVDGAHVPGMIPVDLDSMNPDFWTGNLHKWTCAPKGAAVLYVRPELAGRIAPAVTSHSYGSMFPEEFFWTGTDDPTAYLSAPAAIEFMASLGWARVHAHNHALVRYGSRVVAEAVGERLPVPDAPGNYGAMAIIEITRRFNPPTIEQARALQARLYERERIEVPFMQVDGRTFIRISAQVYNAPEQYHRLAEALIRLLAA